MPTLTASYSGFVNSDTAANLTTGATVVSATAASANAGTYNGTLTASGVVDGNYAISYAAGTLTINQASLTVSANPQTKVYGTADPALTYGFSGLVNGDNSAVFSGALTRVAGPNVGNYAITLGTLSAGSNYAMAFTGSNFAITPATLNYVANSGSIPLGSPIPPLSGTVTGFVNGDTQASGTTGSLTFTTTATAASPLGSYAIMGSGLTALHGNYLFVQDPGNATALRITNVSTKGFPPGLNSYLAWALSQNGGPLTDDSVLAGLLASSDAGANLLFVVVGGGTNGLLSSDTATVSGPIADLTSARGAGFLESPTAPDRRSGALSNYYGAGSLVNANFPSWGNDGFWR